MDHYREVTSGEHVPMSGGPGYHSPAFRSESSEVDVQIIDQWLPPAENINAIYAFDKIKASKSGNFNVNKPLNAYMSKKIDIAIQNYEQQKIFFKK